MYDYCTFYTIERKSPLFILSAAFFISRYILCNFSDR